MKKILLSLILCFFATYAFADAPVPRATPKVAMLNATSESRIRAALIGVDNYADSNVSRLFFCGADMKSIRDAFLQLGASTRDVVLLTDPRERFDGGFTNENAPTKERVVRAIEELASNAEPDDSIFLCLSGHGIRRTVKDENGVEKSTSYFCPQDVDLDNLDDTLISLPWIFNTISQSKARFKTIIVDACRSEFKNDKGDDSIFENASSLQSELPNDVLLLTSCATGQKSYEDFDLRHGVFTYFLTEALLRRAPELQKEKILYFNDFWRYVESKTAEYVRTTRSERQTPQKYSGIETPDVPIRTATIQEKEPTFYENAIGMEFLKIPSGEKSLVSKRATETRTTTLTNSTPYYIGIYEVTEKEYRTILGLGEPEQDETEENVRRSRFPIVDVSWEDAAAFVKRLNETIPPEGDALLGEGWRYDLPTKEEWEYAFAYNLDETSLNDVYRNFDDYAQVKPDLDSSSRLAYVGLKRPVGQLFDMLGNASEWCLDASPDQPDKRGTKGGSFEVPKVATEHAFNPLHVFYVDKESKEPTIGLRLAIHKIAIDRRTEQEPKKAKKSDDEKASRDDSQLNPPIVTDFFVKPERTERSEPPTERVKERKEKEREEKERENVDTTKLVNLSSVRILRLFLKDPTEYPIGEYDELSVRPLCEYHMPKNDASPKRLYLDVGGKIYYYELEDISEMTFDYDADAKKWKVETRRYK